MNVLINLARHLVFMSQMFINLNQKKKSHEKHR